MRCREHEHSWLLWLSLSLEFINKNPMQISSFICSQDDASTCHNHVFYIYFCLSWVFFQLFIFLSPVIYFPMVQPSLPITMAKTETAAFKYFYFLIFSSILEKEKKKKNQTQQQQQKKYSNLFPL